MHKTDVQRYVEEFVHYAFFTDNLINNCMEQKKSVHTYFDNLINNSSLEQEKVCTLILTICARGTPRSHLSVRTLIIEVRHHH